MTVPASKRTKAKSEYANQARIVDNARILAHFRIPALT